MTVLIEDLSDNNSQRKTFTGFAGVILKLYPAGSSGFAWLKTQYASAVAWRKTHTGFIIGFYAADSTPTWSTAKAAAAALGVNLNDGPFAFDLREFGYSRDHVKTQVAAAHAGGQHKVGEYYRLADTGDWHWKANYVGTPAEPWLLHQFTDNPEDHSRPHDGVTAADIMAATTQGEDVALDAEKDAKTFKKMLDAVVGTTSELYWEMFTIGIGDAVIPGRDHRTGMPNQDAYQAGYDFGLAALAGSGADPKALHDGDTVKVTRA